MCFHYPFFFTQPPAPLVRMMDDENEPNTSKHPPKQAVSKLQGGAAQSIKPGHDRQTTLLVPSKGGVSSREPNVKEEDSGSSRLGLDTGKLHSILRGYGEYPAKYR